MIALFVTYIVVSTSFVPALNHSQSIRRDVNFPVTLRLSRVYRYYSSVISNASQRQRTREGLFTTFTTVWRGLQLCYCNFLVINLFVSRSSIRYSSATSSTVSNCADRLSTSINYATDPCVSAFINVSWSSPICAISPIMRTANKAPYFAALSRNRLWFRNTSSLSQFVVYGRRCSDSTRGI